MVAIPEYSLTVSCLFFLGEKLLFQCSFLICSLLSVNIIKVASFTQQRTHKFCVNKLFHSLLLPL